MDKKPQNYYRVFALLPLRCGSGMTNVRVMSERSSEAEAQSRKREILMAHPPATVRIEKTDESERNTGVVHARKLILDSGTS